jgi:glutamate formiminotransferase
MEPIVECVPNLSEGRNDGFMQDARDAFRRVKSVALLDASADADHNRSVYTLAGSPTAAIDALLLLAQLASERIDLRTHVGQHPRIGAMDVAPFVPITGITGQETVAVAQEFAQRLWCELAIPSFFYGLAATTPSRRMLQEVRRVGFEGLLANEGAVSFDVGTALHPTAGATAIGVRKPLIAWNVDLATEDVGPAKRIARAIRESSGGFPAVKALGLHLPSRNVTQISMNLVDYARTPPQVVFSRICELAEDEGVSVIDSELIGLIPEKALGRDGAESLRIRGFKPSMILENRIEQELDCELR